MKYIVQWKNQFNQWQGYSSHRLLNRAKKSLSKAAFDPLAVKEWRIIDQDSYLVLHVVADKFRFEKHKVSNWDQAPWQP